jgi:hypothetical protein
MSRQLEPIVVADLKFGWLAAILQVLRRHADGAEGIKDIARADAGAAVENHVGDEGAILAQHYLRTDG